MRLCIVYLPKTCVRGLWWLGKSGGALATGRARVLNVYVCVFRIRIRIRNLFQSGPAPTDTVGLDRRLSELVSQRLVPALGFGTTTDVSIAKHMRYGISVLYEYTAVAAGGFC